MAVADSGSGPTRRQSKHNRRPAQLAYYLYEGGRACRPAPQFQGPAHCSNTLGRRSRLLAKPAANLKRIACRAPSAGRGCSTFESVWRSSPPNETMPAWVGHGVGASARSSGHPRVQGGTTSYHVGSGPKHGETRQAPACVRRRSQLAQLPADEGISFKKTCSVTPSGRWARPGCCRV